VTPYDVTKKMLAALKSSKHLKAIIECHEEDVLKV